MRVYLYVCVYVCVCVCMYVCVRVCVCRHKPIVSYLLYFMQVQVLGSSKEQVQEEKMRFDKEIEAILQHKPNTKERKLRKTKSSDDNKK